MYVLENEREVKGKKFEYLSWGLSWGIFGACLIGGVGCVWVLCFNQSMSEVYTELRLRKILGNLESVPRKTYANINTHTHKHKHEMWHTKPHEMNVQKFLSSSYIFSYCHHDNKQFSLLISQNQNYWIIFPSSHTEEHEVETFEMRERS